MPEILIKRVGRAMLPANKEAEEKLGKLPEGRALKAKVHLPRSTPAHRMFFAVIGGATENWPHGVEPNPDGDTELLRAWLLCRAGHCDRIDFPFPDDERSRQMVLASVTDLVNRLRASGQYPFIRMGEIEKQPAVRVFISKSMDYEHLDEAGFIPIRQHIYDDIEAIVGVRVDDLVRETEAAA